MGARAEKLLRRPVFVALFALYPVLYIASVNPGQASFGSVVLAALAAACAGCLGTAILRPLMGSWERAAAATLILIVLFFAYGPIHSHFDAKALDAIARTGESGKTAKKLQRALHGDISEVFAWVAVFFLVLVRFLVKDAVLPRLTRALNGVAAILITLVFLQMGSQAVFGGSKHGNAAGSQIQGLETSVLGYNPDIYYIILDGYARGDVFKKYYGFDNGEFLGGLESRGFQVSTRSFSNYYWTFLSLPSSLNLDYLPEVLGKALPKKGRDFFPLYDVTRNNAVARFLQGRGYRFVHFQTSWGATFTNPYADEQVACRQGLFMDEFFRTVAEASWLKVLQSRQTADLAQCHLHNLEVLSGMGSAPGPKFVFAHFIPPHHPYLFDRDGKILRNASLSNQMEFQKKLWEDKASYVDQTVFMNRRITAAVDAILKASPKPPIIILQSDHGPNLRQDLSQEQQQEIRFANFAAYLLPGAPKELMKDVVSPVNEFRRVFDHYFSAGLALLPDRRIYSGYDTPFKFEEVSAPREKHASN